jgi:hypothetical protein
LGPTDAVRTQADQRAVDPFREWIQEVITRCPRCGGHLTTTPFERGTKPPTMGVTCSKFSAVPAIDNSS